MLHSWRMRFEHPIRGAEVSVEAPPQEPSLCP
jgi:23S rRNA-/tRNA-specific pseudouridylate synthase